MHHTSNSTTQRGQTTVVANLLQIAAPETRRLTSEWENKTSCHSGISNLFQHTKFERISKIRRNVYIIYCIYIYRLYTVCFSYSQDFGILTDHLTLPGVSSNRSGNRGGDRNKSRHQHLLSRWPFENCECEAGNWKRFCGKCGDWKPILEKRRNIPIIRDNDSNVSMTLTFYEIC